MQDDAAKCKCSDREECREVLCARETNTRRHEHDRPKGFHVSNRYSLRLYKRLIVSLLSSASNQLIATKIFEGVEKDALRMKKVR